MPKDWIGDVMTAVLALAVVGGAAVAVRARAAAPGSPPTATQPRIVPGAVRFAIDGQMLGEPGAPITIVEFSDFECPFCRQLQQTLRDVRAKYPNTLTVVFRHFPLAGHANAVPAALAAECAAVQGKFEPFADLLFSKQDSLGLLSWEDAAARVGVLDTARFRACRSGTAARARLDADVAAGVEIGVNGTPALLIGDRMYLGALPEDSLLTLLRKANGDRPLH